MEAPLSLIVTIIGWRANFMYKSFPFKITPPSLTANILNIVQIHTKGHTFHRRVEGLS